MTMRTNSNTRAVAWGCLWRQLERYGIPTDSDDADTWDRANGNYGRAKSLLGTLTSLCEAKLAPATVHLLADVVVDSYTLGYKASGPPDRDPRDSALDVVRDLMERHQIKPTDV